MLFARETLSFMPIDAAQSQGFISFLRREGVIQSKINYVN
jgi:hypothetical protein